MSHTDEREREKYERASDLTLSTLTAFLNVQCQTLHCHGLTAHHTLGS